MPYKINIEQLIECKDTWVEKGLMDADDARHLVYAMEEIDYLYGQIHKLLINEIIGHTKNFDKENLLDAMSEYNIRLWEMEKRFGRVKSIIEDITEIDTE